MTSPTDIHLSDPQRQALLAEVDLLRRTLVRCSQAVRDPAPTLQQCLRDLRQALRGKEALPSLRALLPRLENVLAEGEYQQSSRMSRELAALSAQVARLEQQPLPQDVREAAQEFALNLTGIMPQQAELVSLHKSLLELHWQALKSASAQRRPPTRLFKRLLGNQEAAPAAQYDAPALINGFAQVLRALLSQSALPMKYQIHLRRLLGRLHGDVETAALIELVDGLGELVLEAGEDQLQLLGFLAGLNERLIELQGGLATLGAERSEGAAVADDLDQALRRQVDDMQVTVSSAVDLQGLQQSISCRLEALLDGLAEQRAQREAREEAVTASLHQLSARIQELEREADVCRRQLNEQRREALRDPLTGLANRTAWNVQVQQALERRHAQADKLALAVLDVDHFKQVNDRFGHLAGDKVLKLIADILRRRIPEGGFLARYGGEEFVLLLPGYDLSDAQSLLRELLASIQDCPFHFKGERLPVTLSAGLACFEPNEDSVEEVFHRADQALYQAKQRGRNCLVAIGPESRAD